MRPILFRWRGLTIYSYPAMLYLGLTAALCAADFAAHDAGLPARSVYVVTLVLIAIGLFGARLLFVASHWRFYRAELGRIWNRREGGASQYGGLLLALAVSVPCLAAFHLPLGAYWDVGIFAILVGTIFARVGCLLNGCCSGRGTASWFGVRLPNHSGVWARRIPTQCLEAACAATLLGLAIALRHSKPFPGALFLFVVIAYACGRLVLESAREHEAGAGRFTLHHALSVGIVVSSLITLVARWPT